MSSLTMREFALHQTAVLLRRLAYEVHHTAKRADNEAIHDLRVAIRRFSRCLRVFGQFYRAGSWKKIRRQLADVMEAAGGVRDCDIALQLLVEAGVPPGAAMAVRLESERREAAVRLQQELRRFRSHNLSRKWRAQLELKS